MSEKKVLVFSRSFWNEPPRLRHQLTNLLQEYSHKVIFFERGSKSLKIKKFEENGILILRHFEFLHHQLKPFNFLVVVNNFIAKYFIKKAVKEFDIEFIVNFNYDYSFLKQLFPDTKIITIINDDFVAQGKPWMKESIKRQLSNTCKKSDLVFTVSYPLQRQINEFKVDTSIFFPWAGTTYLEPTFTNNMRDVVLFWGYIDHRIDWLVIKYLLSEKIKIRFIGNIQSNVKQEIEELKKFSTFELFESQSISSIDFSEICCSILPYNLDVPGVNAISISNRAFQLLTFGVPLIYSNLPELMEAPQNVIRKCYDNKNYLESIKYFTHNFNICQSDISFFLKDHYSEDRYKFLLSKIRETSDVS